MDKIRGQLPKSETLWKTIIKGGEITQMITSNKFQDKWFLYENKKGKVTKIETAKSPVFDKEIEFKEGK